MGHSIRIRVGIALTTTVLLSGCNRGTDPHPIRVEVASATFRPAWIDAPDVTERVTHAVEKAAAVWGGADLSHVTIRLVALPERCQDVNAIGCTSRDPDGEWIVEVAWWGPCAESTILSHEVGHLAIVDTRHADPRWCDPGFWTEMGDALAVDVDATCADLTRARVAEDFETPICQ